MKILLVTPISDTHYVVPPIGLGYLASALRRNGFNEVRILDCIKEKMNLRRFEEFIEKNSHDVVGFQIFSCDFATTIKQMEIVKKNRPETIVIIGGVHVSTTSERVLDDAKFADYGFCGESEVSLPKFMNKISGKEDIPFDSIEGLVRKENGKTIVNQRLYIEDLNAIEFPAWDLMDPRTYPENPQGAFFKNFPIAPISTSRGCPYLCTFCASHTNMGRMVRFRSIENVMKEMDQLYYDYNVREFHIIDDVFNLYKERVYEFCQALRERNWDISYTFPNGIRLNTLDREVLQAMKETGVYSFTVGIESGSQRILNHMKKSLTLEEIEDKVNLINEAGLHPSGFFIIGYPAETEDDIKETIKFAKKLKIKRAHFSNFLPLPGTEATRVLQSTGEVGEIKWGELFYSRVPYSPPGISKERLKALQRKAFISFHLRWRIIIGMLSEIKSLRHIQSLVKRMWDYLFTT
ncbi:MAG: B12-binding domain-containing radical SAM protein [Candidatus Schekmanbacteria bacterium]|nr:B12-binding domain-containing radical SAM protein [Candidatus Schekmanbacteria bacterium]